MTHNDCYPSLKRMREEPRYTAYLVEENNRWQMGPGYLLIEKATGRRVASYPFWTDAVRAITTKYDTGA